MSAHVEDHGLLRFLTCGSVDDGKSTLIGRLLFDTKAILADTLTAEGFATDLVILPKLERTACLWHPSLADHALIAETLTASIRKDLPGWRN